MSWGEALRAALEQRDYQPLIDAIPYAAFIDMRAHVSDETVVFELLPRDSNIGNPLRSRSTYASELF